MKAVMRKFKLAPSSLTYLFVKLNSTNNIFILQKLQYKYQVLQMIQHLCDKEPN
jgi:hypothetical protein